MITFPRLVFQTDQLMSRRENKQRDDDDARRDDVPSSEASRRFAPPQIPFTFPLLRRGAPFRWSSVVLVVVRVQLDSRKDGPLDRHLVWRAHFVVSHLRIAFGFCGYTRIDRPNRRRSRRSRKYRMPPVTASFGPLTLPSWVSWRIWRKPHSPTRESSDSVRWIIFFSAKAFTKLFTKILLRHLLHYIAFSSQFLLQRARRLEKNRNEQEALKRMPCRHPRANFWE